MIDVREYCARGILRDGRTVTLRAIRPDDKQALRDGLHRLSPESVSFRFFSPKHDLTHEDLAYFTELDFVHHVALLAVVSEGGADLPVAVGRYILVDQPCEPRRAEIALTVDDAHQGLGIGTILLKHLSGIARSQGIAEFVAMVRAENRKMLRLLAHSGLPMKESLEAGVVAVRLSLTGVPPRQ